QRSGTQPTMSGITGWFLEGCAAKGNLMRCAKVVCVFVLVHVFVGLATGADGKRSMATDDLFRFRRVADPQMSADGTLVAYTLTTVDLAGNKTTTNIWLAPATEGKPRQLTGSTKHDRHPRWSPDGK